jgi:orotate phosphoribosyltransferase
MELPVRRGNVPLRVVKGHFATNHSHINYYIDVTKQKVRLNEAKAMAKELAKNYTNTQIDAILCLDGMSLIGACLAEALTSGPRSVCDPDKISLIEPEYDSHGHMIFRDNVQPFIRNKNVLILMASITTGYTANRGVQTTVYYGGKVVGVAGLYRAVDTLEYQDVQVVSVFDRNDLPDYHSFDHNDCPYCKDGRKLDALVNSHGYSKL